MAITRLRADQQVSQSSITENELSSSLVGNGLTGGEGTALAVQADGSTIVIGSSGIKAGGGVISGSADLKLQLPGGTMSGSVQTKENLPTGTVSQSAQILPLISVTDGGGDGSLAYNNSTGVLTFTGPSAAEVRAHITEGTGIDIASGVVTLDLSEVDTSTLPENTNLYYTDARVLTKMKAENVVSGTAQIEGATIDRLLNNITASGNISASGYMSASGFYGSFVEISSSVVFTSGSSIFGDDANDTHEFTGSADFSSDVVINGETSLNGKVNIGDADGDDIDINGQLISNIIPSSSDTHNLGSATQAWKDLHVSGTAYIQTLDAAGFSIGGSGGGNTGVFTTVDATNLYASGGVLDGVTIGGTTAGAGTFTTLTATTANLGSSVDINGGNIDGTTIATSDITVGAGKTLNVSAGTLTVAAEQITADKIKGGTFGTTTDFSFAGSTITNLGSVTTADINGGTIDGTTIGASTPSSVVASTLTSNGLTILGDANTDNIVFTGEISSSIVPNDDDQFDLGSSTQQWKDLYIDGTANIDSLVADSVDINGGTIDGITSLTAGGNLDIGNYALSANQLSASANPGTAPLVVESNTLVTNLNADKLDGQEGTHYLEASNFTWAAGAYVPAANINGTLSQWTASSGDITRDSNVTITGSLTTTGNITSDGKIYKETLMRSFKFGVTASFKGINSSKFEWKTPEHIRTGSEMIFVNGMLQDEGDNNDYTIINSGSQLSDGAVISFNYKVPSAHSKVKLMYVPK